MAEKLLYPDNALPAQQKRVSRKKMQFVLFSLLWAAATFTVCLLQGRQTQTLFTFFNGLTSAVYFSYILYFFSFDFKREKKFLGFLTDLAQGETSKETGIVIDVSLRNKDLEEIYYLDFHSDTDRKRGALCYLSKRSGVDPALFSNAHVTLRLYHNHVVGIEVLK